MNFNNKNPLHILAGVICIAIANIVIVGFPFAVIWVLNHFIPSLAIAYNALSWIIVMLINFVIIAILSYGAN